MDRLVFSLLDDDWESLDMTQPLNEIDLRESLKVCVLCGSPVIRQEAHEDFHRQLKSFVESIYDERSERMT